MRKVLGVFLAICILIAAAELGYIFTSPRLGIADLESVAIDMHDDTFYLVDSSLYLQDYPRRPHVRDPWTGMYKLRLVGWWVLDSMMVGVNEWKTGTFASCETEELDFPDQIIFWKRMRPSVAATGIYPVGDTRFTGQIPLGELAQESKSGIIPFPLGWWLLADSVGGNAAMLYTDACGDYNNMSAQELRQKKFTMMRSYIARTSFVDSVVNERDPWRGILYLSYYPWLNKTFIALAGLDEQETRTARFTINGKDIPHTIIHPFIYVDGLLAKGENIASIETDKGTVSLSFIVPPDEPFWVEPIASSVTPAGNLTMVLLTAEDEVTITSVEVDDGSGMRKFAAPGHMPAFNATRIDAHIRKPKGVGQAQKVRVRFEYIIDGKTSVSDQNLILAVE